VELFTATLTVSLGGFSGIRSSVTSRQPVRERFGIEPDSKLKNRQDLQSRERKMGIPF
ncbi:MAG: hypothetical protein HKO07_05775, partial [Pseudomonadales bacterium]|nr:hypothetical protein [Pseudomonadales bacterium]